MRLLSGKTGAEFNSVPVTILVLCALLSGCLSIPLTSMWKLRKLDLLTVNPSNVRIAVITDKIVQLEDGSASLIIGYQAEELPEKSFETKVVTSIERNAAPANINYKLNEQEAVTLFYLNETDAERLRKVQQRVSAIKKEGIKGEGTLAINVNISCLKGPPPPSLNTNVFLQFDQQQGFIKMLSNVDLLDVEDGAIFSECAQ